ncbi:hypothetical protein ACQJBY_020084 [Aegilops geniculata]
MVDIENPAAAPRPSPAGDAAANNNNAATAEPSRHGFWAWKERFIITYFTHDPPDHGDDDEDAAVDADECSRFSFLCLGVLAGLAVFVGAMLLLVFFHQPSQSTAGSVVYIAVRVLAISGLFVGLCWAGFFLNLCDGMCEGDKHAEVMIDRFM